MPVAINNGVIVPTTYTLSISLSLSATSDTGAGFVWDSGTDVDSQSVPELSGTGSIVLYQIETDNIDRYFDSYGYNSGSGFVGYYDDTGSPFATLRVSGTTIVLSGNYAVGCEFGQITCTKTATAKIIVLSSSRAELYADSGIALPQLASLTPSGTISRVQYIVNQSVSGHVGKYSVKPIGNQLYRFR